MKKLIQLLSLCAVILLISACSSAPKRDIASDPCPSKYFVDEYSHFEEYESCNDY